MSIISSLVGGAASLIGQMTSSLTQATAAPSQAQAVTNSYTRRQTRHEQLMAEALRAQGVDEETIPEIQGKINETIQNLKATGPVSKDSVKYAVNSVLRIWRGCDEV